ncbi:MAG: TlpA family protein disulfide reductase, partial [Planctomycetia bacterium]|nr:TlpA family protein disulfide reductase [Planctomycetia bacterium]
LRALDEVEVLPEGVEAAWAREGVVGELTWRGAFKRAGGQVTAEFTFSVPEKGGARVAFETGTAKLTMLGGWARGVEGKAAWTVATKDGTERREVKFAMTGNAGSPLKPEDVADAAGDAAPLISAQEAWRDGERDRALELWDKAGADAGNRWGARARVRAIDVRRDAPLLGQAAPAVKAPAWIGAVPEAGKWTVVYFWATWIPRCEGELRTMATLLKGRTRVQGASVTRVDALQAEDAVRDAASRLALPFGIALDDGSLARGFKVEELPRVFVVDAEGKVRFSGSGGETETLKALLDRLVPE